MSTNIRLPAFVRVQGSFASLQTIRRKKERQKRSILQRKSIIFVRGRLFLLNRIYTVVAKSSLQARKKFQVVADIQAAWSNKIVLFRKFYLRWKSIWQLLKRRDIWGTLAVNKRCFSLKATIDEPWFTDRFLLKIALRSICFFVLLFFRFEQV